METDISDDTVRNAQHDLNLVMSMLGKGGRIAVLRMLDIQYQRGHRAGKDEAASNLVALL